jgi:uncharacterized membrane protein
MSWYAICVGLHLLALTLWLGHMFVWSLIVGPAMKGIEPASTADALRSASLSVGGLGWPALVVLIATGLYLLSQRGIDPDDLLSGSAFQGSQGTVLAVKLVFVAAMLVYQTVFGHRSASIAVYFNMLSAIVVVGASVILVRGWVG